VTKPARSAGLVEENSEGDATNRAKVRVYSFDNMLLVVDRDPQRVDSAAMAELVASMARDTQSVYQAMDATVKISGHGYQVQLPPTEDAGFEVGDTEPVYLEPSVLVVTK